MPNYGPKASYSKGVLSLGENFNAFNDLGCEDIDLINERSDPFGDFSDLKVEDFGSQPYG